MKVISSILILALFNQTMYADYKDSYNRANLKIFNIDYYKNLYLSKKTENDFSKFNIKKEVDFNYKGYDSLHPLNIYAGYKCFTDHTPFHYGETICYETPDDVYPSQNNSTFSSSSEYSSETGKVILVLIVSFAIPSTFINANSGAGMIIYTFSGLTIASILLYVFVPKLFH